MCIIVAVSSSDDHVSTENDSMKLCEALCVIVPPSVGGATALLILVVVLGVCCCCLIRNGNHVVR